MKTRIFLPVLACLAALVVGCDQFTPPGGGYAIGDDPGIGFANLRQSEAKLPAFPEGFIWFGDTILHNWGSGYQWQYRDFTEFTNNHIVSTPLPLFWPGTEDDHTVFRYNNLSRREAVLSIQDWHGNYRGYVWADFRHIDQPQRRACFRLAPDGDLPRLVGCFNGYLMARKSYWIDGPDTVFIYNLNQLSAQDTTYQDITGKHAGFFVPGNSQWVSTLLRGQFLYMGGAGSQCPLEVYDLADPLHPALVWRVQGINASDLQLVGNTLFCHSKFDGIRAFDASDPARLYPGMGVGAEDIYAARVKDSILYLLTGGPYLNLYNIADIQNWKHLRRIHVQIPSGTTLGESDFLFFGDTLVCFGVYFTGNTP